MIVTHTGAPSRTADHTAWRCLARRGMVHSECEAVDHLRLPPRTSRDGRGRAGVETLWFVLDGEGRFDDGADHSVALRPGDLVLWPGGTGGSLHSGPAGPLELVAVTVLPAAVSGRLPARSPVAPAPEGCRG